MPRIFYLVTVAVLLSSCSSSLYRVTDHYMEQNTNGGYARKDILLRSDQFAGANLLVDLINKRQWTRLEKEVELLASPKDKAFIRSIQYMIQGSYASALPLLQELNDGDFECQVKILKTDCLYEIKATQVDFLKEYQAAVDCTSNPYVKSIAQTRFRFYKYGM